MNIGSIRQNEAGIFIGRVSTLAVTMTIALREVRSANPKAPKYEVHALNTVSREWVQVGALFELFATGTGEAFLNGRIDDPSLAQPLYVSAFRQGDGTYNIVWQRPQKRRDVASALAPKGDDALPPLPGAEDAPAGTAAPAGDGLGTSTTADAFGAAPEAQPAAGQRGGRRGRTVQPATPELVD